MASTIRSEDNTEEVLDAIDRGIDMGLKEITEETNEAVTEGFQTGHDALGRPWEPLAPSTLAQKSGNQILVESGEMLDSKYTEVSDHQNKAWLGFTDGKIRYHEFGAPSVNLPARPVLGPAATYAGNIADWKMKESFDKAFANVD